jgi:AhpD family alkylhydroperoxidase
MLRTYVWSLVLLSAAFCWAAEPSSQPKEIPATRSLAKQALENLKKREARLPLPPPTAAERKPRTEGSGSGLGGGVVNNGRMRNLYLPEDLRSSNQRSGGQRPKDPHMTLDNAFGVELFWIASRANNCHYCLGHQEMKLLAAGLEESRIAALDSDWSRFTPANGPRMLWRASSRCGRID